MVDSTGNRRWLPVRIGMVDLKTLARDVDQLWAEGLAMFTLNDDVWWEDAFRLGASRHEEHMVEEPWEKIISDWLFTVSELTGDTPASRGDLTSEAILSECLRIEPGRVTRADQMRVGDVLKKLGFSRERKRILGGRTYFYTLGGA